jgi:hypothetical protein
MGGFSLRFFILTGESLELMNAGLSDLKFVNALGMCRTTNPEIPEAAVAYEESFLQQAFNRRGLAITEPIRYGSWSGRQDFVSYQDIIVVRKAQSA